MLLLAPPENALGWALGLVGVPHHIPWPFLCWGNCSACCLIKGPSPDDDSRVLKCDIFPWPGGAGTRRLGLPPPWVILAISTRWGLSVPPSDIPAISFLSGPSYGSVGGHPASSLLPIGSALSILSLSRWAAASAHQWASLALASLQWSQESSSHGLLPRISSL